MSAVPRDALPVADRLRITEVFHSLQGEAATAGVPTAFIRLTGCPLRCQYCDTAYAFTGGDWMSIGDILDQVDAFGVRHVCVTGGEPLAQPNCHALLTALCERGFDVSLETSGAMDIRGIDRRVSRVLDIKTPGSGEVERNLWENLQDLRPRDQVKFVVCDRPDFEWLCEVVTRHALHQRCTVWASPSFGQLDARLLADWVLESGAPVRFQLQLHKILWNDEPGR
jgi:7-carboxy-7-deazaguanine synthase